MILLSLNNNQTIYDFSTKSSSGQWRIVNDVVMGGISKSDFIINKDSTVTFKGTLYPDNNGGFASVRTYFDGSDLNEYSGIILSVRGDKIYDIRFRTNDKFDGYAYQAKFHANNSQWTEIKISFSDFKPTFRGRILTDKPNLSSNNIRQIGIMIADKQFGDFCLDLDWIKFYK